MLKKWLRNKLQNILRDDSEVMLSQPVAVRGSDEPEIDGLRFTVMSANGGTIVQLRQYDRKTDRSNNSTYIITDEEDIAVRIGQIVSMELLKS